MKLSEQLGLTEEEFDQLKKRVRREYEYKERQRRVTFRHLREKEEKEEKETRVSVFGKEALLSLIEEVTNPLRIEMSLQNNTLNEHIEHTKKKPKQNLTAKGIEL